MKKVNGASAAQAVQEGKREAGVIPARSRHCNGTAFSTFFNGQPLMISGRRKMCYCSLVRKPAVYRYRADMLRSRGIDRTIARCITGAFLVMPSAYVEGVFCARPLSP